MGGGGGGEGVPKKVLTGETPPRGPTHVEGTPFGRRLPQLSPPAVPVLGHYSEYPLGLLDDDRPVSRTYMLTQAVHCSSLSLLEKRSAFRTKKLWWNNGTGMVEE